MAALNTNDTPFPIWGFGPPSPEPDTKTLDALLASLNGSAERFQTLWFSFLGLTLYLAITALATTHRMLLLGEPQTLPILNIKVELLPFYIIAPLLYLVFHFYLLMMLALLARTAAEFDKQLRTTPMGEPERERYRAQVGNSLFLQLLVGMKGERTGVKALLLGLVAIIAFIIILVVPKAFPLGLVALLVIVIAPNSLLLSIIALITVALAPLATLILMQMMFLPYHHLRITWWHRGIVVADLGLITVMTYRCFFPRGFRRAPLVLGELNRKRRWVTALAFCILLAAILSPLGYWLSFKEGRWAGEPHATSVAEWGEWMEGKPPPLPATNPDYAATEKDIVFGLFPDRLKLANETIVGKEKWEKANEEIASRKGAKETPDENVFVPTIKLDDRDFQAANLSGADLRGVSLNDALLEGADLSDARLGGARLSKAQLQDADLDGAQLQGANLNTAQLEGAYFEYAQLQGADLRQASLQGAILDNAELEGADLGQAQLQGASLDSANLQGASLIGVQLSGAFLPEAQLQGADLQKAHLQGVNFAASQLQGANLFAADLHDSRFNQTFVFRTNIADAALASMSIGSVYAGQVEAHGWSDTASLSQADLEAWIVAATQFAAEKDKGEIRSRFARLKSDFQTADEDAADEAKWRELTKQSLAADPYRARLAMLLGDLACGTDGAPYVARSLASVSGVYGAIRLCSRRQQLPVIRDRMEEGRKIPNRCPGVVGFNDKDWRALDDAMDLITRECGD